jgi:hypothetical protein
MKWQVEQDGSINSKWPPWNPKLIENALKTMQRLNLFYKQCKIYDAILNYYSLNVSTIFDFRSHTCRSTITQDINTPAYWLLLPFLSSWWNLSAIDQERDVGAMSND